MRFRSVTVFWICALAACGDRGDPPPGGRASMLVENQSQYELRELRIHDAPSYLESPNRLAAPLAVGGQHVFYGSGTWHVTVFRERNRGGEILAFTTVEPVKLSDSRGYKLEVFDGAFRLVDHTLLPEPSSNSDAGVSD